MNTKHLLKLIAIGSIFSAGLILAQELPNNQEVSFPVAELGNCSNKEDCKEYCDRPANVAACLDFAEKHGLMSQAELHKAKKFVKAGMKGPGGCNSEDTCHQYCDNIVHVNECVAFAEANDLLPPDELAEAKKIQQAINSGVKPPACTNKKSCDSYCSKSENMEECITFAEAAGFLENDELQEAKKMLQAIKKGVKPPPCSGKNECESYCTQEKNINECVAFAEAAGIMSPQELEMLKKTGGKGPGGCRGKEACDKFCETNLDVCIDFAVQNGLMDAKDAEMAKKTGGKGPGGCQSKEECESFCNNPLNQETCFNFSREHGFINDEQVQVIEKDRHLTGKLLSDMPEARECIKNAVGEEVFSKIQSGTYLPSRELGEKMGRCFEQFTPRDFQGPDSNRPGMPENMPGKSEYRHNGDRQMPSGPGGCASPEECREYCQNNPQECGGQRPMQPMQQPDDSMPNDFKPEMHSQPYDMPHDGYPPPINQMPPGEFQGEYRPPEGSYQPPLDYQQAPTYQAPQDYQYQPPPDNNYQNYQPPAEEHFSPPPPSEPSPSEPVSMLDFLGAVIFYIFEPMTR